MNRNKFESLLRETVGAFSCTELPGNACEYQITHPLQRQYRGMTFFITGGGMAGIGVSFYDRRRKQLQNLDKIYHRSLAYELLYLGLTAPERLVFDKDTKGIRLLETLDRHAYDFAWEPGSSIAHFPDETIDTALSLIEYGYISGISYNQARKEIEISASVFPCGEDISLSALTTETMERFAHDEGATEQTEQAYKVSADSLAPLCTEPLCPQNFCIIGLCGYLEYTAVNGFLYDLLLERKRQRAAMRTPQSEYAFTWNPAGGLKTASESMLNLALSLAEKGQLRVDPVLLEDNSVRIWYNANLCSLCPERGERENTTCLMASKAEIAAPEGGLTSALTLRIDLPLNAAILGNSSCEACPGCAFLYAGYIRYLLDTGAEAAVDQRLAELKDGEPEETAPTEFFYDLPEDLFFDMPQQMFQAAEMMQAQNLVSLHRDGVTDEYGTALFVLDAANALLDEKYNDLDLLIRDLREEKISRAKTETIRFFSFFDFEALPKPVLLSAYIDYLRRSGKYGAYRKQIALHRKALTEDLDNSLSEIPQLEKVLATADNEKESGLYCVIQGERGVGKRRIVQKIAKLLAQRGKIDEADYALHTFDDLASLLGYKDTYTDLGIVSSENQFSVYAGFEKRKLYVLTDLKEFLYAGARASDGDGSKISHLIKLLGRYQPETYIIVIGEEKYVSRFLTLSPKIKFLFEHNIIPIQNLSAERMYADFTAKLSQSLQNQLTPEFENRFLTYIALNRKLLPLANQELCDYLAGYANNQKALLLPPDVYRKKSVGEMLDSIIGMDSVKRKTAEFERYAIFLKRAEMEGLHLPSSNLHMIFTGNPGTGKTMIARLIGQLLFELGIVAENKVLEVEAKDLKSPYIGESAIKTGKVIEKAMGGVLFIDEAYAVGDDAHGKEAIATLIKAMEDYKDKLVVIFAGYEKEMEDFLAINSGIASRIGYTFHFDDYTAEELTEIFHVKMQAAGFTYDETVLQAVFSLCEHFAEKKNFGNGRFMDKVVQQIILNHAARDLHGQGVNRISSEEVPTIEEMISTDVIPHKDYEEQLAAFIGMDSVKTQVRRFAKFIQFQQTAKAAGAQIPPGNMHMVFTGNPGTGKTAVARVMVDLLYDIGMIKENKLIEVERKDLVAEYVGQTAVKTAEVIERALDGVLFIDEAYTLTPSESGGFEAEAIATLMKAMEDHKHDLIVIFAGYKEEMRRFINANAGLASRIGTILDFPDYTPSELKEMFRRKMETAGFSVSENALKKVAILSEHFTRKQNFGNGRFIAKLQQQTFMRHAEHICDNGENLTRIDAEDIPEITELNHTAKKLEKSMDLDRMIGLSEVKEKLKEFEKTVNFSVAAKERGLKIPDFNMHMIFSGNPGTGKTTVARMIAEKLCDIGVIKENKLIEVERKDLIAGYIGQTAIKTGEVIEKAMGGVLFIDEAYTLTPSPSGNDFSEEAIAALMKAMEDHKDDLIVIFAGYEKEMNDFIRSNPGIASRIGFTFRFSDYTPKELTEIFTAKMSGNGFTVTDAAQEKVWALASHFSRIPNFGNGRFVDRVIQSVLSIHAGNYKPETIEIIDAADIPAPETMEKIFF